MKPAASVISIAAVVVLAGSLRADPVPPQSKMGDPLPGLTTEQLDRFLVGRTRAVPKCKS